MWESFFSIKYLGIPVDEKILKDSDWNLLRERWKKGWEVC